MSGRAVERDIAATTGQVSRPALVTGPSAAEHLLALQRSAGNQAVGRLVARGTFSGRLQRQPSPAAPGTFDRLLDAPARALKLLEAGLVLGTYALAALANEQDVERAYKALLKRLNLSEKELERLVVELAARERFKQVGLGGRLPGEVDIKAYPLFAYRAGAAQAVAPYLLPMVYAIPIVGQAIAVAEAVVGRSFFTGEKLKLWERALALTLSAIPVARGLWRGLTALARVSVDVGMNIAGAVVGLAVRGGRTVKQIIRLLGRIKALRPSRIRGAIEETRKSHLIGDGGASFSASHKETAAEIVGALNPARARATYAAQAAREEMRIVDRSVPGERYFVTDPASPRLYAEATLSPRRELTISIRTTLESGARSNLLRGAEQFARILTFFKGKFTSIKGNWQFGSNLAKFNELTGQGISSAEAAARTWTGQQAAAAGYRRVSVQLLEGAPGRYTSVQVLFQP